MAPLLRIALIAPPFVAVPPVHYGGTELFVAHLAGELHARGHEVTVYANGESRLPCAVKSRYPNSEWPLTGDGCHCPKNADHFAWAVRDAIAARADVIHLNDAMGVPPSQFARQPVVHTIHHPHDAALTALYTRYPEIQYVAIARWLKAREPMPHVDVVHHGIRLADYECRTEKDDYVAFLGRMAPCKGPHLAIAAARRAGVRIKLAGEIQPVFQDYWDREVAPLLDGDQVEFVGPADLAAKNALLSRARAVLFPIQWEEPFGLVMIEAMACGTPVLAFAGGSVEEVISPGETGFICRDVDDMAARIRTMQFSAEVCRGAVERRFSVERMTDGYVALYERLCAARKAA